jgi:tryptophan synthase alpha chain
MSRIGRRFQELKDRGEKGLIAFITAGDPDLATTAKIVPAIARAGADIVELGIPFSDPLADGPSIQAAAGRALAKGASVAGVLDCVRDIRATCDVPLVLMTCFNPILQFNPEWFATQAKDVGVDGVLVSDLPPGESGEWVRITHMSGLDTIFLVAPTTPPQRIEEVCERSTGFVYCVSRTGVTGARDDLPPDLGDLVSRVRARTDKPIGIGFGISTPEQVRAVCRLADAAIVGSAIVDVIAKASGDSVVESAARFVSELKQGTL